MTNWNPAPAPRSLAPRAFEAWDALTAQAFSAIDPDLLRFIQARVVALFGGQTGTQASAEISEACADDACAEAIEQFLIDVSAMTEAQRDGVHSVLGPQTYPFFQALYACDFDFRLRHALAQLFDEPLGEAAPTPASDDPRPGPYPEIDLWPSLDRFLTDVAALDRLDPLTTELVRLRGARAHNCRICQSRREVAAISSGADEETFDKIDFYESSDLPERHKVALRLTDAVIWSPARYPAELVGQVRATFSPEEAVEIVLDLVRNATNKVAVALQADQALVASGVEYFRLEADGSLAYGLAAP